MVTKRGSSSGERHAEAEAQVVCPPCSGSGRMKIQVSEDRPTGVVKSTMEMKCITCNGAGKVSLKVLADLAREQEMWCRCTTAGEPEYYGDGEDGEIWKHHWKCRSCGGVLQIG